MFLYSIEDSRAMNFGRKEKQIRSKLETEAQCKLNTLIVLFLFITECGYMI